MSETHPKPAKRKRTTARKTRHAPKDENVSYLIRVSGWDYYYAFRGSDPKSRWDQTRYIVIATLTFAGALLQPADSKYQTAEITLSAKAGILREPLEDTQASIGSLTASGAELSAYIFIPAERLAELTTVAQTDRIRLIRLIGSKLRYRSGLAHNISLSTRDDEEDW